MKKYMSKFLWSLSLRHVMMLFICCTTGLLTTSSPASEKWTDISTTLVNGLTNSGSRLDWPGGCSGVIVNRTNGDVTIKVVSKGLWRSSDKGKTWQRIDENKISGRDETGWATSADQNSPGRMASFSLDGSAGWTVDGSNWQSFANLGRNWDYGSIDWATQFPKTIIAAKHETTPPGEVYISLDGGANWKILNIHLNESRDRISMVGALGATTFIYGKGDGIHRSTDVGATWTKVSSMNPQTRIPVLFHGAHYLGAATGLIVSKDQGLSWQSQGTAVNIWLGPFFGKTDKQMMVVGNDGVFITMDGGDTWKMATSLKPKEKNFSFGPNWFGCYAWDPINSILYASAMGNPVYRFDL